MTQGGQSPEAFVPVQVGGAAHRLYNTDPIVKRGEEEEEEEEGCLTRSRTNMMKHFATHTEDPRVGSVSGAPSGTNLMVLTSWY